MAIDEITQGTLERENQQEGPVEAISHNISETAVDASHLVGEILVKKVGELGDRLSQSYEERR